MSYLVGGVEEMRTSSIREGPLYRICYTCWLPQGHMKSEQTEGHTSQLHHQIKKRIRLHRLTRVVIVWHIHHFFHRYKLLMYNCMYIIPNCKCNIQRC